jgi:hypothetical protein
MKNFMAILTLLIAQNALCSFCEITITDFDLDQVTPKGFSGRHLLNLAEGEKPIEIQFPDDSSKPAVSGKLVVRGSGGRAKYIKSVDPRGIPEGGWPDNVWSSCIDKVEVRAHVNFISDDGIFNEKWDVVLTTADHGTNYFENNRRLNAGEYVNFTRLLVEEDFSGDFRYDFPFIWQDGRFWGQIIANNYFAKIDHIYREGYNTTLYVDAVARKPKP